MAAKRFFDDDDNNNADHHQPNQKKTSINKPTFASVIREALAVNFFQNVCSALEPTIRKVVSEEVESGLRRCRRSSSIITRSPSLRIVHAPEPSSLQLTFSKKLSVPIFTGMKILDVDSNNLKLFLVDTNGDGGKVPITLPYPIKIEIVVLDGDFALVADGGLKWTEEEFSRNIVKERTGKRPLLTGDLNVTMRDGVASVGDLEFTDNSSWIRSRRFRVGARVVPHQAKNSPHQPNILGAMTESFVVKDHRGELYKKHHPPALEDEVWRLEKIGKDGAFHKKLSSAGISTVQDFLKLSVVDQHKLRRILGNGMSDRMWEVTNRHARNCVMGNKLYVLRRNNFILTLDPICQLVRAEVNGQTFLMSDLNGINRTYIENLVKDAYANWNSLQVVDNGIVNETAPLLLTQGDVIDHHQHANQQENDETMMMVRAYGSYGQRGGGAIEGCSEWAVNAGYLCSPVDSGGGVPYNFSESSSDGDLR